MMVRDPLDRSKRIRVNDGYDNQDIVVENALSQKKQFNDLPRVNQLTQNSFNMSPFTREDVYKDVVISNPRPIGRIERYRTPNQPDRYHER